MADSNVNPNGKSDEPTLFDQPESSAPSGEDHSNEDRRQWPPQDRFPLNLERSERRVESTVQRLYEDSSELLIVTAFTSLEHLLVFFGEHPIGDKQVDIVLGNEPSPSRGSLFERTRPVDEQARDYWLRRGVSVLTGGGTARLLRAIDEGKVRFYAAEGLHAKIYVGDEAAVVGSSNFSRQGMREQREANARFEVGSARYEELREIAEQYLEDAEERTDRIADLLERLLQPVTWQEALARGAAEILEGDWMDRYPDAFQLLQQEDLWPHQEQAIAQGLWILE